MKIPKSAGALSFSSDMMEPDSDRQFVAFSGSGRRLGSPPRIESQPPDESQAVDSIPASQDSMASGSTLTQAPHETGIVLQQWQRKNRVLACVDVAASWQCMLLPEAHEAIRTKVDDYCCSLVQTATKEQLFKTF